MELLHLMGQSLTHLLVHAIFSTKDRRPFLRSEEIRDEIYAYMAGTLKADGSPSMNASYQSPVFHPQMPTP
jgi:hypothetical protein